ncbi:hypothetical protein [Bradyrhizobium sp. USDA 4452]
MGSRERIRAVDADGLLQADAEKHPDLDVNLSTAREIPPALSTT